MFLQGVAELVVGETERGGGLFLVEAGGFEGGAEEVAFVGGGGGVEVGYLGGVFGGGGCGGLFLVCRRGSRHAPG